jgi:enamine deaminase RidA (YjgF/YER057c/UK114 family)
VSVARHGSGGPWEESIGYSRVVIAGPWALTAGCTSTVDGAVAHVDDAYAQTLQSFRIALDALAAVGVAATDVVRTRMYATPAADLTAIGRAHGELFGAIRPAATLVVVAALLDPDHLIEVEVEAYLPPPAP